MKYAVIAGALSLFSITAVANQASSLSYDYVEVGYAKTDVDGLDELSFDGYVVKLSKQLGDNWYLTGLYASTADETLYSESENYRNIYQNDELVGTSTLNLKRELDAELTRIEFGAGYIQQLSAVTNIDYSINLGKLKYTTDLKITDEETFEGMVLSFSEYGNSDSNSAEILAANVQVRHLLTEQFEVNAGLGYERLHDDESDNNLVLQAGFNFALTDKAILGASYRYVDEYADIAATLRYYF